MKQLEFHWGPQQQRFCCDDQFLEGHGTILTDPSHDLVHLIIAANGQLAWQPTSDRNHTCMAEYNAVLLEHIFVNTFDCITLKSIPESEIWPKSRQFMQWFTRDHYAPFPMTEEEAAEQFLDRINPKLVSRLFPYFFSLKFRERTDPTYRRADYHFLFTSEDDPASDKDSWAAEPEIQEAQRTIRQQLSELKRKRELAQRPIQKGFGNVKSGLKGIKISVKP